MTIDPHSGPGSDRVPDKDELQRAVEEKVEAADAAAGTEPVVNAPEPVKRLDLLRESPA